MGSTDPATTDFGAGCGSEACLVFDPAIEFPNSKTPSFTSADEYQFNATMRRQPRS